MSFSKTDFQKGGNMSKNIVIITGASSGIGKEFAHQMDPYFPGIDEIWLIARNRERLQEVADSLQHKTRIFAMDITSEAQIERLTDALEEHHACIRMLINCAGYGLMGSFAKAGSLPSDANALDVKGQLGMVRLNCEALTHMTHCCLPYMAKKSRIIQLSSSAAFLPQPGFSVYAATKSYVLSFSRALGEELRTKGIYVTSVCPGPVDTPFFDIAEKYGSTLGVKKYTMVSAEKVVKLALRDSFHKRPMSVCSLPIRAFQLVAKCVPHRFILTIMRFMK